MAYESYCASCTHMKEELYYGKYYCTQQNGWRKANDPKCWLYCEAYSRSSTGRENMYKNSSNYYITTAILNILRALDNNHQIEALSNFIENNLRTNTEYLPLLYTYEIIGPQIASSLQNDKDKINVAIDMFYHHIKPTIKAIENNNTEKAIEIYKNMTINLATRYNISLDFVVPAQLENYKLHVRKRVPAANN